MDLIFRLMSNTTFKFELNSKPNKQGLHSILLRVTYGKKLTRFNSGQATNKTLFKSNGDSIKKNWVKDGDPNHEQKNDSLSTMLSDFVRYTSILKQKEIIPSGANIKAYIKGQEEARKQEEERQEELKELERKGEAPDSFLNFFKNSLDSFQLKYKWSNYLQYVTLYNLLEAFNDEIRKGEDLKFKNITETFLSAFENWLLEGGFSPKSRVKEKKKRKPNTVQSRFRKLHVVVKKAVIEGKIPKAEDPFHYWKTTGGKVVREKLSIDEVQSISEAQLPENSIINEARNAFLFSFYCAGIRVSDLLTLTWKNVENGRLKYTMKKTSKPISIILLPEAKAILNRLIRTSENKNEKIFKFYDRAKKPKASSQEEAEYKILSSITSNYNNYLERIRKHLEIETKLSSHISRHSFADYARKAKLPLTDIQNLLGHTQLAVTQAYFKQDDIESTDEALMSLDFSNNAKG